MVATRKLPDWVEREYGSYGSAWWEAVDQCRKAVTEWAAANQLKTYTELSDRVDAIPWPEGAHTHEGSQIGWLLGQVAAREWAEGRPLLSAVVVGADTREPSHGFFDLAVELGELRRGVTAERRHEYWVAEVARCFQEWERKS